MGVSLCCLIIQALTLQRDESYQNNWPGWRIVMPTPLSSLIEHREKLPVVKEDEIVENTMRLMLEYNSSHVPVVNEENQLLGMVSNESIINASKNFGVNLERLHVSHATVKIDSFNAEDDLFDVLDSLMKKNAVAVVDDDNLLLDILTIRDAMLFYQRKAEDFLLVEEIESMMKDLITFSRDTESINNFDQKSLGNYIDLLLANEFWAFYEPAIKLEPNEVRNMFDKVRQVRNHLAHFQGELDEEQRQILRFCIDWLTPIFENLQEIYNKSTLERASPVVNLEEYSPPTEVDTQVKGKYAPLAAWLQGQPGTVGNIRITFEQVEQIIGADLPPSAYSQRAWWANDSVGHVQSKYWLDAGWRVSYRSMSSKEVNFVRIKERERAYIDFFGPLMTRLRGETELSIKGSSPDGASWIEVIKLPDQGRQKALIGYSFALQNRFRIELYIDTGTKEENKAIFDQLFSQRVEIEAEIGKKLSWERIDKKRASRIALYHTGNIQDDAEKLSQLEDWVIKMTQSVFEGIFERACEAIVTHSQA